MSVVLVRPFFTRSRTSAPERPWSGFVFGVSLVKNQYGDAIRSAVKSELKKQDIAAAEVTITDRGAIDPVLRARMECVIKRGRGL